MSIRKIAFLAALCALAAVSLASSAMANTYVRNNSTSGTTYYTGALSGSLQSGTQAILTSSSGNISCSTGAFGTGNVGASGGASVSATITSLTFGSTTSANCTDTLPFVTIHDCHLKASASASVTATSTTGGTLSIPSITVTCVDNSGSFACDFTANGVSGAVADGNMSTVPNSIAFSNVSATSSNFGCPASGSFSATFSPITGSGGTSVYVGTNAT